jgi:hypothetical protein
VFADIDQGCQPVTGRAVIVLDEVGIGIDDRRRSVAALDQECAEEVG